jgi:mono/diheme cytochrome c family protein
MQRLALVVLAACTPTPAAPGSVAPVATAPPATVMSDPDEYAIARVSREAGEAIFTRTGIGDPYRTGLPYPIFLALERAFPDQLGATTQALTARFGFVARAADPASDDLDVREGLPIGMHLTIDPITGVAFVMTSCALCHVERLRWPGDEATIVGLGNKRVRVHAYDAAFGAIAGDRRLTGARLARLAAEAAAAHQIAWPEAYRDAIVAATLAALHDRAAQRSELAARTADGPPGRVATIEAFVPALAQLSGQAIAMAPQVGWAKIPDVIGFAQRTTLSWDGSGEGPMDLLAVEADLAIGARVAWLERHPFQGASLGAYLRQPAARPRFPRPIDRARADRGRALFGDHCAACHGSYAGDGRVVDYHEAVVALDDVGTDPARALAATDSFARAANDPRLTHGYTRFRRTAGYVPPVLTNVWARAPYGHAGQWASLAVVATPPERRAAKLVIDLDAPYDLDAVGVATYPAGTAGGTYAQDAARPGFAVTGHPFLADLGREAADVIEYLKTL